MSTNPDRSRRPGHPLTPVCPGTETGTMTTGSDRTQEHRNAHVRSGTGRGERTDSPRRVAAHLRAEIAVRLRAQGMSYAEIAATTGEDGRPMYSSHRRAQEAVRDRIRRGTILIAQQLGDHPESTDPTTPAGVDRVRRELLDILRAVTAGDLPAISEHTESVINAVTALAAVSAAARA